MTKKFMFLIMLLGIFAVASVSDLNAQEIKDGDTVNLANNYKQSKGHVYLDSRYWVKDKLKNVPESVFVMTSDKTNRDNGSGAWIIRKVNAYMKNYRAGDGSPIKYGDTVYLINRYPNAGFLDIYEKPIDEYKADNNYAVFTSAKRDRNGKSSQWKIVSTNPDLNGKPVMANNNITLESVNHPGFHLETHGVVVSYPVFNNKDDRSSLVVWATKGGNHAGSSTWRITPSKDFK